MLAWRANMTENKRPSWDDYFIHLMMSVGERATCNRGKCGCVIVKEKRIITTGYVGSPPGFPHCDEAGHELKRVIDDDGNIKEHCVRTIHAEQNAICQAARYGIPLEGATLYCKMEPCRVCAMLVVSAGIVKVVALNRYAAGADSRHILATAGVELTVINDQVQQYPT